jgi:cytochrome P450
MVAFSKGSRMCIGMQYVFFVLSTILAFTKGQIPESGANEIISQPRSLRNLPRHLEPSPSHEL